MFLNDIALQTPPESSGNCLGKAVMMTPIPTRQDVADQLRALIAGTKTREEVSVWACQYAMDDNLEIPDEVLSRALKTLVLADAVADMKSYLYGEADFREWLDELML